MLYDLDFGSDDEAKIPVTIKDKKYTLEECLGESALKYKNEFAKCVKPNSDGKFTSLAGLPATQILLISLCLRDDVTGKLVTEAEVMKFPQKAIQKLFETIQSVNQLAGVETLEDLKSERQKLDERIKEMEEREQSLKNE